jgi:hypothetical protein
LVTDEVAARGVRGTRGVVAKRFSLGSGQPKPRAGRRKHIADGPKGAASRGASKAKADPSGCVRQRGSCKWEGPSSRMTHFSTTNFTIFHEWEAASTEILLVGLARVHSFICGSRTSEQDGRKARFGHR